MYRSAPRAAGHGHAGAHRRPPDDRLGDRRAVRGLRAGISAACHRDIPEFLWELSLGIYLTFKGFKASGLQKLGFEPDESGAETAPKAELRSVA